MNRKKLEITVRGDFRRAYRSFVGGANKRGCDVIQYS